VSGAESMERAGQDVGAKERDPEPGQAGLEEETSDLLLADPVEQSYF
jgi:hypothetical protein